MTPPTGHFSAFTVKNYVFTELKDLFNLYLNYLQFPVMYFHTKQAGEGDCHVRAREASRDQ